MMFEKCCYTKPGSIFNASQQKRGRDHKKTHSSCHNWNLQDSATFLGQIFRSRKGSFSEVTRANIHMMVFWLITKNYSTKLFLTHFLNSKADEFRQKVSVRMYILHSSSHYWLVFFTQKREKRKKRWKDWTIYKKHLQCWGTSMTKIRGDKIIRTRNKKPEEEMTEKYILQSKRTKDSKNKTRLEQLAMPNHRSKCKWNILNLWCLFACI